MARFVTFARLVKPVMRVRASFTLTSTPAVVDVMPVNPAIAVRSGFRRTETVMVQEGNRDSERV